ncbi:T-lymphocyte surface antigen Ly-9-like, partial [Antrostomus carolinensis]|uniref:T-lymphocyte surface antigen Ly-9-like n=1 Tax=Antrostomus carolinensis TaxID=279965 RepID=UPI0010A990CA
TVTTQPHQVSGVLGGSVLLSPTLSLNETVKKIEWSFSTSTGATIQIAELGLDGLERPDPQDRFQNRLEMFNQTTLKIQNLQRGDNGIYGARLKLLPALVKDQVFNLSIYGSVPTPEIRYQHLSLSTQGCNVTLRCWVPAGSDAELTWQLNNSSGTRWGQLCEDRWTLCLAVPTNSFNSSYTCVAKNPTQEKNVTIQLDTLCWQQ